MIVRQLKLVNWKNFSRVDISLRERVFVIGVNAAGKSNLLDVFRFLRDIARKTGGGFQTAVAQRGGLSKIRSLAARQNPLVEVEIELGEPGNSSAPCWRYAIGIRQENKGKRRVMLKYERVWKDGQQLLERPNADDQQDEERLTRTFLENPTTNEDFRYIADFFGAVAYLHLVPQLLRSIESSKIEGGGEDFYGRNFLVKLSKTPNRIKDSRLHRILKAMRIAVPQFADIKEEKDDAGVPHLMMRLQHWRLDAGWQKEDQFSDGTIRMIGLFWSLLEGDSLLLFEEPELSLNDRIVAQLPSQLWKLQASKGRQVILTTHSNALLSDKGIPPEQVVLLHPTKEGTEAKLASEVPGVNEMIAAGMSVGEAVLPHAAPENVSALDL
jgi:predicted ATPase